MIAWVLLATMVSAPAAAAGPEIPAEITVPAARDHFAAGMGAWIEEDYAQAQRELEAAYALDPAPVLLYSLGQLSRLQGDCVGARARFEAFLATDPPQGAANDTRVNIDRCRAPAPVVVEPLVDPVGPAQPPAQPEPPPRRRPDALGLSLTIAGATVLGVGVGLYAGAFAVRGRADDATTFGAFKRGVRRADAMYWSSVGLMSVGTAVLVGGIVRLVLVRRRAASGPGRRAASRR